MRQLTVEDIMLSCLTLSSTSFAAYMLITCSFTYSCLSSPVNVQTLTLFGMSAQEVKGLQREKLELHISF